MANKYIIHDATYNGDGTSSAEATSNGGVGAWNTISILTGSTPAYGVLNTGDTVFIRSKTAAGADIAVESAAIITLGANSKTVRWVLDNGVTWPGIDGTLTVRHTGSGGGDGYVATRTNNHFIALRKGAWIVTATNYSGHYLFTLITGVSIENMEVSLSAVGSPVQAVGTGPIRAINCHFKAHSIFAGYSILSVGNTSYAANFILVSCTLEVTNSFSNSGVVVFSATQYGGTFTLIGGKVVGTILESGGYRIWNGGGELTMSGFKFPNNCLIDSPIVTTSSICYFTAVGCDALLGAEASMPYGRLSSRKDGNFPTLNALLPGSNTPWAWWIYPHGAGINTPFALQGIRKSYEQPDAQLTLTLELLASTTFTELSKENCYVTVCYVDATTSAEKVVVSRVISGGALDNSAATWTFTSYGAIAFDKKKITIQTPTEVKQNSVVEVCFFVETPANSTTKILILCPDVQAA